MTWLQSYETKTQHQLGSFPSRLQVTSFRRGDSSEFAAVAGLVWAAAVEPLAARRAASFRCSTGERKESLLKPSSGWGEHQVQWIRNPFRMFSFRERSQSLIHMLKASRSSFPDFATIFSHGLKELTRGTPKNRPAFLGFRILLTCALLLGSNAIFGTIERGLFFQQVISVVF